MVYRRDTRRFGPRWGGTRLHRLRRGVNQPRALIVGRKQLLEVEEYKRITPSRRLLESAFLRLGEGARTYYDGLCAQRGKGASYHLKRILRLADRYGESTVSAAMAHAAPYGNYSADAVSHVISGAEVVQVVAAAKEPISRRRSCRVVGLSGIVAGCVGSRSCCCYGRRPRARIRLTTRATPPTGETTMMTSTAPTSFGWSITPVALRCRPPVGGR